MVLYSLSMINLDKYKPAIDTTQLQDHEIELWFGIGSVKFIRLLEECTIEFFSYNIVTYKHNDKPIFNYYIQNEFINTHWSFYTYIKTSKLEPIFQKIFSYRIRHID